MTDATPRMSSNRPYLIRAMHEWISDNGMTPYLLVDAEMNHVQVPRHAVKDGRIVLNIAGRAVASLQLGNDVISFMARFSGVSQTVQVPVQAVLAIYAQETGQGMMLPQDDEPPEAGPDSTPDGGGEQPKRPHLRVVK